MPAYKYFTKDGKTKWYANFYYEDWLGKRQHVKEVSLPKKRL